MYLNITTSTCSFNVIQFLLNQPRIRVCLTSIQETRLQFLILLTHGRFDLYPPEQCSHPRAVRWMILTVDRFNIVSVDDDNGDDHRVNPRRSKGQWTFFSRALRREAKGPWRASRTGTIWSATAYNSPVDAFHVAWRARFVVAAWTAFLSGRDSDATTSTSAMSTPYTDTDKQPSSSDDSSYRGANGREREYKRVLSVNERKRRKTSEFNPTVAHCGIKTNNHYASVELTKRNLCALWGFLNFHYILLYSYRRIFNERMQYCLLLASKLKLKIIIIMFFLQLIYVKLVESISIYRMAKIIIFTLNVN